MLEDIGVKVVSLTFDGTATNISMAHGFGCNLKINDKPLVTSFKHPTGDHQVFVILDPCHMLKLVRNVFASQGVLNTPNGQARWDLIVKLNEYQNLKNVKLASKLTNEHVFFENQKMKVALAAQILSQSVAYALHVMKLHDKSFDDADGTVQFVALFNNLFDVMNSSSLNSNYFKSPLCPDNFEMIDKLFSFAEQYIRDIRLPDGQLVTKSIKKTGFLGFLVGISSFRGMYNEYVEKNNDLLNIPAYQCSQDHVETFFAAMRAKGGSNNNLSAPQFKAAYKRLLTHNNVTSSDKANFSASLNETELLSVEKNKSIERNKDSLDNSLDKSGLGDEESEAMTF